MLPWSADYKMTYENEKVNRAYQGRVVSVEISAKRNHVKDSEGFRGSEYVPVPENGTGEPLHHFRASFRANIYT